MAGTRPGDGDVADRTPGQLQPVLHMADANQLKIQARRKEAAGEYARASELYLRALSVMERGDSLPDPSLLVRVADLEYRLDDRESALEYYKRAVEDYAEQGLITNAIAVCNKILRVYPECVECHRRLADLHMDVGLVAEARQNLLRYVQAAEERQEAGGIIPALRSFLERTPDQEIALKLAARLEAEGRTDEALDVLRAVWEERHRADADVEGLERKARELDPGADPARWAEADELTGGVEDLVEEPAGEDTDGGFSVDREAPYAPEAERTGGFEEEPEAEGAEGEPGPAPEGAPDLRHPDPGAGAEPDAEPRGAADADPAEDGPREDAAPGREPGSLAARAAGNGDGGDRSPGSDGPDAGPGGSSDGPGDPEERWRRLRRIRGDEAGPGDTAFDVPDRQQGPPLPEAGERLPEPTERLELVAAYRSRFTEAASGRSPAGTDEPATVRHAGGREPGATGNERHPDARERPDEEIHDVPDLEIESRDAEPSLTTDRSEEPREGQVMEHGDWGTEIAEPGEGRWDDEGFPESGEESRADGPPAGGETLGEEAELRRGLELVDELLEVQPDSLELRERRLRYARRLGDRELLVETCLDLAELLAKEDRRRSARVLYRRVLELDPENQTAESGLARLDVGELEEKRQSGKRAGAAEGAPTASTPEEQEARRELGMRLWTEFENSIREMPWLHAATQAYQSAGPDALPPLEAFEMLAHYLMARDRHGDAADVLVRALDLSDARDEEMADILYYLGVAHREMGDRGRAEEYFERLAEVDPEFERVRSELPDDPDA